MNKLVKTGIETTVKVLIVYDPDTMPAQAMGECRDEARIKTWMADEWHYCGVRAQITIHNWQTGNHVEYTTAGLWGIESDSEKTYLLEVGNDELHTLLTEFPQLKDIDTTLTEDSFKYVD